MKVTEFRKLIREEVRKVLTEVDIPGALVNWSDVMDLTVAYGWNKKPKNDHIINHAPSFTGRMPEVAKKITFKVGKAAVMDFASTDADPINLKKLENFLDSLKSRGALFILFSENPGSDLALGVNAESSIELGSGKIVKNVSVGASGIKFGNKSISFNTINNYLSTKPGKEGLVAKLVRDSELLQRVMIEAELGISDEEGVGDALKTEDPKLASQLKALVKFNYL